MGEGTSLRFPEVVSAIHRAASTRPNGFCEEPHLSAQLNAARHLPVHKDKNHHGRMTQIAEALATALPVEGSPNSSPFLAARLKDDELALKAFGPSPAQAMTLTELSEAEKEDVILWCASDLVSFPCKDLPCSDGSIDPLSPG